MLWLSTLLESHPRGDSNRSPKHIILWRNVHFFLLNTNPRFPPFLLDFRCKSGVTLVRRCHKFRDEVSVTLHLTCVHIFLVPFRLLSGQLLGNSRAHSVDHMVLNCNIIYVPFWF